MKPFLFASVGSTQGQDVLPPAPGLRSSSDTDPHVLLVLDQFPKSLGGGERIVLRLAALLPQYGYRVSILTFAIHPDSAVLASPPACPVYLLPLQRTYDWTAFKAALELHRFIRAQKVKIVQTFFESSDLWAGPVAKLAGAKVIWSRRDMGILRGRKHQIAYRILAGLPDQVSAVSEQVRRHGIEVDGIASEKVKTIYNGLDVSASTATPVWGNAKPVVITTVGNIRRVKGHDVLLQAAAEVLQQFPDVLFSIAGEVLEPEYFQELEQTIARLGLGDHVRFVGGVTDPRQYLEQAQIFVLPSRSEGFSNSIIEAMAVGLPVVATEVGGNAEAVENGSTGLIVPSEDPAALAGALCRLLNNPNEARHMGLAGRQRAYDNFTTAAMMSSISGVYTRLIKN